MTTYLESGVDWQGAGYHAQPFSREVGRHLAPDELERWDGWHSRFQEAKRGDFSRTHELASIYEHTSDWRLAAAAAGLLGDAGDERALQRMRERLLVDREPIVSLMMRVDFPFAFTMTGRLDLLPTVIDAYSRVHTFDDADIIPFQLSSVLEADLGVLATPAEFDSIEAYRAAVLSRIGELQARWGPRAALFLGEPVSVPRIAQAVLASLSEGDLDLVLRQRFEASTGINTTSFYQGLALQPLTAAAIVEEFLRGPDVSRYQVGIRYFFGHPIPAPP